MKKHRDEEKSVALLVGKPQISLHFGNRRGGKGLLLICSCGVALVSSFFAFSFGVVKLSFFFFSFWEKRVTDCCVFFFWTHQLKQKERMFPGQQPPGPARQSEKDKEKQDEEGKKK